MDRFSGGRSRASIRKLAVYFEVPETELLTLAGYEIESVEAEEKAELRRILDSFIASSFEDSDYKIAYALRLLPEQQKRSIVSIIEGYLDLIHEGITLDTLADAIHAGRRLREEDQAYIRKLNLALELDTQLALDTPAISDIQGLLEISFSEVPDSGAIQNLLSHPAVGIALAAVLPREELSSLKKLFLLISPTVAARLDNTDGNEASSERIQYYWLRLLSLAGISSSDTTQS